MINKEIFFIIAFILIVCFVFYIFRAKKYIFKPSYVKKDELIEDYKKQMKVILEENQDNSSKQVEEKLKFIKKVNQDLSMNLFFDENEAKTLINELAKM